MKTKVTFLKRVALLLLLSTLNPQLPTAHAQGTAFTYQGRLNDGATPANGTYDLRSQLNDAATGGNQWGQALTNSAVTVSNGLFTTTLDFGFGVLTGGPRWLQVGLRTNGGGGFVFLAPRTALSPAPYAVYAANAAQAGTISGTVPASGLNGLYSNPVNFSSPASSFAGDGSGLLGVNAATLNGVSSAGFWKTNGNAGADPANGAFLGTTDNLPLEFKVNNQRGLRLEPTPPIPNAVNVIGGSANNFVSVGTYGATIGGGGGGLAIVGFSTANSVEANFGTVSGGVDNRAGGFNATVPGGGGNQAMGQYSFAAGRNANAMQTGTFVWADSTAATFSSTGSDQFCIRARGGVQLDPLTSLFFGLQTRQMLNLYGTSYGIGVQASSLYFRCNNGSGTDGFIWYKGGSHNDAYANSGGGTELMHLIAGGLYVNGTFVSTSDRNAKENFAPVQPREVLEKVVALPLSSWNYKADTATRHVGPMAQDFYAAFNVGPDDKHIATVDADGVALAAIQGLNQKLEADAKAKDAEIETLKQNLATLEKIVQSLVEKK